MMSLLPTELWDYGLADAFRGFCTALTRPRTMSPQVFQIPELGPCVPVRSARAGIILALKALALPTKARIGVPLYCCPVVFKAVHGAGCTTRFIDVDPATCCMSASDLSTKSAEVDAVIAVHMFGNMCDMPALRQAAPGKPFIEDCAQSLGSKTGGISAGGFGDISVFSFHLGKYVSVGKGGALFARNPELRSKLAGSLAELPVPSHLQECIHVLNTLTRSLLHGKQLYGLVGYHLWRFYSRKVNYSAQSPLLLAQIYATDLDAVTRRLPKLKSTINRQRTNAAYYSRTLAVPRSMLCFEQKGQFFNRLQYPVLFPSSEVRDAMVAYMHRNHIVAGQPYSQIAAVAAAHHGYRGDCPNAERVARGVIVIPCNWRLQDKDRARVANSFNAGWLKISAGASRQVPGLMATRRAFPEPAPE